MGDAGQAMKFDVPRHHDSAGSQTSQDLKLKDEHSQTNSLERCVVLYSRTAETAQDFALPTNVVCCSNFDDLLLLLEDDKIESIWFDTSISSHEKSYVTGWARIFRPDLTTHNLQREDLTH